MESSHGGSEAWNWQDGVDCLDKDDLCFDVTHTLWTDVSQNEEDISFMFDETTPVKACGDVAYHVKGNDNSTKEAEESGGSNVQTKRRRMLQFDTLCCAEETSAFINSDACERDGLIEGAFIESQWNSEHSALAYEGLDQATDGWLAQYLNDAEMQCIPDEMNYSGSSDIQIDISEFWNDQPVPEPNKIQQPVARTPQKQRVIFKGRKSYIRTPPKLASSVVYPFSFIKPCGIRGDVTLKDINQRIHTPPSKTKQNAEDPAAAYPTSAFSGKPVVGKTKIRTEGGKGSITIMRTKG